jgi:hypothetical protein
LQSDVTSAESDITTNATAISSLDTRVTSAEGTITSQTSDITTLQSDLTTAEGNITTNATAVSGLTTRVTTAEGSITSNATSISSLTSTVNDPSTGLAATATVASGASTTAASNSTAITDLEAEAYLTVSAGGNISGFKATADASGSTFTIQADQFALVSSDESQTTTPFAVDTTTGTVTFNADVEIDGDLIATGTIVGNAIGNNEISDDQVLSLDGDQTSITNLQVANLSGDVSEVFNLSVFKYPTHTVPTTPDTFTEFSIPAPDSPIYKYASLIGKVKYIPSTSLDDCLLVMQFERKSKGTTTGASIGTVVGSGNVLPYTHYVEVSGNHTKEIDVYGGIGPNETSGAGQVTPKAVEYIGSTDRTRIVYSSASSSTPQFTSGTLYYNPDRWTSASLWLSDAGGAQRFPIPDLGSFSATITLPLTQPLAKSNAAEDYRIRVNTQNKSSGSLGLSSIETQVFLMT